MKDERITIALFDFDHTITVKDTFIDFTVSAFGMRRVLLWMIFHLPSVAAAMSGLAGINNIKNAFFRHFFSGMTEASYHEMCLRYANECVPHCLNPVACARLEWHRKRGDMVIVISASLEGWIAPWAAASGVADVIATQPEIVDGILTGKFATRNCNGKEKVRRFRERYPDREKYIIHAYGDSAGDREMLAYSDYAYYRRFE
jgi:HAD superfamily hydrolase (TIGR01490 family)